MLAYREDNKKLYVNKGNEWDAIGSEKQVSFDVCPFKLSWSLKIVLSSDWLDKWGRTETILCKSVPLQTFHLTDYVNSVDKLAEDFQTIYRQLVSGCYSTQSPFYWLGLQNWACHSPVPFKVHLQ